MKKRSYFTLIIGAILLIAGIIYSVITYNTSYMESRELADTVSVLTQQIKDVEAGIINGDLDALNAQLLGTKEQKLRAEKPYAYGLTLVFFSILLTIRGLFNAIRGQKENTKADITRLAQAGLMTALCYIGFTFLKIDIPVGPEKTAFHFGNVFCVLAALLLGGYWGGLSGAIGMTLADLTTSYVTSAPKTFLLKLCIGLIVGFIAHVIFKISRDHHSKKYLTITTILSCCGGMIFNIIADPIVGYFYKMYLLGIPQDLASALAKMSALTTSVNAVLAVTLASLIYLALRPALKKSGLFVVLSPEKISRTAKDAAEDEASTTAVTEASENIDSNM